MFTPTERELVVAYLRERMPHFYKGQPIEAACLYWAGLVCAHLTKVHGIRTILQAGTMQWPCVAEDDGVSPTHFSYVWEPDSEVTRAMLRLNHMPEMHVWAAVPSRNEIIDLTTRYLVEQAKHRAGLEWSAAPPPDFLWCRADALPAGVRYKPAYEATLWAARALAAASRHA